MRKAFDIEDINLDDLIATALDDPQALTGEIKAFRGINFADLHTAYRQFCKNEKVPKPAVDLGEVIDFYNKAAADLPDHTKLRGLQAAGRQHRARRQGRSASRRCSRRTSAASGWRSPTSPSTCSKAFIAAEDKRFYAAQGHRRARLDPRLHRQPGAVAAGRRAAPPSPSRW